LSGLKPISGGDYRIDNYYLAFPRDQIHQKTLVTGLFFMQVFQTVASLVDGFRWFGSDYGNTEELDRVGLIWFTFVLWGPQSG
jgi:hypothetical protein